MSILTTTGARSGRPQIIVASMGDAPRHPAWFHNLMANPRVIAGVGGERFEAVRGGRQGEG